MKSQNALTEVVRNSRVSGVMQVAQEVVNNSREVFCIEEIRDKYNNEEYDTKLPYIGFGKKYSEGHIFDEDKSVKWNKEKVIKENELIKKQRMAYEEDRGRLCGLLRDDCIRSLVKYNGLNEAQAEKLYYYVYNNHHSSMNDFFVYLEEEASFIEELLSL